MLYQLSTIKHLCSSTHAKCCFLLHSINRGLRHLTMN
jgi:hypothetical protein